MDRRSFIKSTAVTGGALSMAVRSRSEILTKGTKDLKIGLIGLDTSHSPAFTKFVNDPSNPKMQGFKVSYAYPYGSSKIESSASRIPQYTTEIKALGVEVVDTLQKVIDASDVIMLMTNDGTLHVEQIMPVLKAKKPVFVDKPVAARLVDVIRIYDAVKKHNVPMFSSSPLRYLEGAQKVRNGNAVGKVIGAEAYSPQKTEPSHTDLFWYGIHGVEILYTLMGTGCESIKRITGNEQDTVIGIWKDGRIGTYKGDLQTRQYYGGTAYGTTGVLPVGPFDGYQALVEVVIQFFRDGKSPVTAEETLELYTFMEAADVSKQRGSEWINLKHVYDEAAKEALK